MKTRRPYKCEHGHTFEVFQNISDPILNQCIHCNSQVKIDYSEWRKDNLSLSMPAFNDIEVNKPEWKKKGRRWTQEHKIKGIN